MDRLLPRERLLVPLRRRHSLTMIGLESPAGYGRSVLIDQALAEGPARAGDRDVVYRCVPGDDRPGALAARLVATCSESTVSGRSTDTDPAAGARAVSGALQSTTPPGGHVALVLDSVELAGAPGTELLAALARDLPARGHLVLSGRRIPRIGLARLVASGGGVLLGAGDLAFRPEEVDELLAGLPAATVDGSRAAWPAMAGLIGAGRGDLAVDYVLDEVLAGTDPRVVRALAAVAAADGCADDQFGAVLAAIGFDAPDEIDEIRRQLALLPLAEVPGGCWPDPLWGEATRPVLSGIERDRAVVAKAGVLAAAGRVAEAGALAVRIGSPTALAEVVRAALASQPPLAPVEDMRAWSTSGVLGADRPEGLWLRATVDLHLGDVDGTAAVRLEEVRRSFEDEGDVPGETALLLHLGHVARANDDVASLGRILRRAEQLAAFGQPGARALIALGRAVAAQLSGDPDAAILALDRIPPGSLIGDWAAQALMIRGTNLLLTGRFRAAAVALESATGEGSEASRAVAYDLLASARWYGDDPLGALREAESGEALAIRAGVPGLIHRIQATRACFLAASGRYSSARGVLDRIQERTGLAHSDEAAALCRIAEALLLADTDDLAGARRVLDSTAVVGRAVRASLWTAALTTALGIPSDGSGDPPAPACGGPGPDEIAAGRVGAGPERARAAGRAAAAHLDGGPPAAAEHRPYLPARWCTSGAPLVTVSLLGTSTVHRGLRPVEHPAWRRSRVRELCLHLALVDDRSRGGVAAALWPDLEDHSAGRNLRVTLTHLLDVLDPDRERSQGSRLVADRAGTLSFAPGAALHIDLWEVEDQASSIVATPAPTRSALLAHARRLAQSDSGPLLGGSPIGEWLEPHRRRLDDLIVAAALLAGDHALAVSDAPLAEALAHRALAADPWSERAQRMVIEARLVNGDQDGARRAAERTVGSLEELGATPAPETVAVLRRVGTHPRDPGRALR